MTRAEKKERFIDETARKPSGERGRGIYSDPKGHYGSFRIILDLLKLSSADRYLEIGCGGGVLLRMALEHAGTAAAIDHSPDMVELSKSKNDQALKDNRIEIVQGDAAALPWANNSFTAVASANMFFFVEQPEKMLKEVYRVLEPGGRFVMVTMNNGLLGRMVFGRRYRCKTYSNRVMTEMLENAGLSSVGVKSKFPWAQICYAVKD